MYMYIHTLLVQKVKGVTLILSEENEYIMSSKIRRPLFWSILDS